MSEVNQLREDHAKLARMFRQLGVVAVRQGHRARLVLLP